MTRPAPSAAIPSAAISTPVLAAALAFGAGYAVRLACAWSAGSVRVVETQEVPGPMPAAAAEAAASSARGTNAAPPPTAGGVDPATEDATPVATDPASPDEVFCRVAYEVFERNGRTDEFRREIDKVAVVPLGRNPEDSGLLDAGVTARAPLVESVPALRRRISPVNAGDGRPPMRPFQFAAYRRGRRFEVVLGDAGLPSGRDPTAEARIAASRSRKTLLGPWPSPPGPSVLAPDRAAVLLAWSAGRRRAEESARRDLWSRLWGLAASGEAAPLDPRDVVGVCFVENRCVVVRAGDDPELDRLVDESDRIEREVRAEVEQELR